MQNAAYSSVLDRLLAFLFAAADDGYGFTKTSTVACLLRSFVVALHLNVHHGSECGSTLAKNFRNAIAMLPLQFRSDPVQSRWNIAERAHHLLIIWIILPASGIFVSEQAGQARRSFGSGRSTIIC
jgi:hypothetical protein